MATLANKDVNGYLSVDGQAGFTPAERRKLVIAVIMSFPLLWGVLPFLLQPWLSSLAAGALITFVGLSMNAVCFLLQMPGSATLLGPSAVTTVEIANIARVARRLSVEAAVCFACCVSTLLMLQLFASSFETAVLMLEQAKQLSASDQGYKILCTTFYGMTIFMVWLPASGLFARSVKKNTLRVPSYWFFFAISAASLVCMRLVNYGKEFFSGAPIQNVLGLNPLPGVPSHWAAVLAVAVSLGIFILLNLGQALFMWTVARFTQLEPA